MKIVYVGKNIFGQFAFRTAAADHDFIDFVEEHDLVEKDISITDIFTDMMAENGDVYIIDLDVFEKDREDEIVSHVYKLKEAINNQILIHAPMYNESSKVLLEFKALGINNITTVAQNQGLLIDFFRQSISENIEFTNEEQEELIQQREDIVDDILVELPHLKEIEKQSEHNDSIVSENFSSAIKIAVVGAKSGIGTTTVSIQLVKYFNSVEDGSAAYVEMNDTGYVNNLLEHFDYDSCDEDVSLLKMSGVPLFYNPRRLSHVFNDHGYKFYIYDYGKLDLQSDLSIYEKDAVLLVGGIKANEIVQTTSAIENFYQQRNVFYIMNFIPERNREAVMEFMEEEKSNTYFMCPSFDPFVLSSDNNSVFKNIIESIQEKSKPQKLKNSKLRRIFK